MRTKSITDSRHHGMPVRSHFTDRAFHLIDAENLLAGPNAPTAAIQHLWQVYRYGVPTTVSDHYVWASSGRLARNAVGALPAQGLRILVRNGEDGADDALIDMVDMAHLARQFDRLVIASGDGKFTDLAVAARAAGLHVHLVTGLSDCSRQLSRTATTRAKLRLHITNPEAHHADPRPTPSAVRSPELVPV